MLRTDGLFENTSKRPIIHLVIVREVTAGGPSLYHMSFCRDFQLLMSRAHPIDYRTTAQTYCISCFQPVPTEYYDKHIVLCGSKSESLTVHCYKPPGQKLSFKYGLKRTPPILYGAFDIECSVISTDTSFGPMSKVKGEFTPVSFSFQTVFNIESGNQYQPLSKCFAGNDVMHKFFRLLIFEVTYCHAILTKLDFPMRATAEQIRESNLVTACANCYKYLSVGERVMHHIHHVAPSSGNGTIDGNYVGTLCKTCNQLFKRSNADQFNLYIHNICFEAPYLIRELAAGASAGYFESVRLYTRKSDVISSMRAIFRCPICHPELIMNERLTFWFLLVVRML